MLSKEMQKIKDDIIRISFYIAAFHVTVTLLLHCLKRNNRSFSQSGENICM